MLEPLLFMAIPSGPFAETKEQLAGFYMLEARHSNEAIRLAEKFYRRVTD
jgi:hypothetical protein